MDTNHATYTQKDVWGNSNSKPNFIESIARAIVSMLLTSRLKELRSILTSIHTTYKLGRFLDKLPVIISNSFKEFEMGKFSFNAKHDSSQEIDNLSY